MGLFFLSILIIGAAGMLPLLSVKHFARMKIIAVLGLGSGCAVGMLDALFRLLQDGTVTATLVPRNTIRLAFRIDGLSAFFLLVIFAVCLLAAVYSFGYLNNPRHALRAALSYFFFCLLTAAMALVVTADNMITFMLAWEVMSLSSFFLVVHDHRDPENRQAGYLYFVFSHVGAMFILAAFGVVYAHTGSFQFASANLTQGAKMLAFLLAFVGFGSKAGAFPLHVWLPHAHPAAPSHISAVMSGVMIKTGIYGILRMVAILNLHTPASGIVVLAVGLLSGVLGVVYALGQHDLKRLLAYHSVENIGIILIGLGIGMLGAAAGSPVVAALGFGGALLHVLNHALFKSLLFMGAGMVLHQTGTRTIDALGGLLKKMKITGTTFLIGSLAICGLPPFNGFVSEFLIYLGSFRGIAPKSSLLAFSVLAIIGLAIIGALALACFTKVVGVVFQGEPRSRAAQAATGENSPAMLLPMLILAAACILIGVWPGAFMFMPIKAMAALNLSGGRIPLASFTRISNHITLAAAVFLGMLLVALALRRSAYQGKVIGQSGTWGCGFTRPTPRMQYTGSSFAASILGFFRPAAPLLEDHPPVSGLFPKPTHYHSHILDIVELHLNRIIVRPVRALFAKLRWIQHGDIHLYIGYIFMTIVVLLFFV